MDYCPEIFFNEAEQQFSVRWLNQEFTDLAATEHTWHSVHMAGQVAYELNLISEMLMISTEVGVQLTQITVSEMDEIANRVTPEVLDRYIQRTKRQ